MGINICYGMIVFGQVHARGNEGWKTTVNSNFGILACSFGLESLAVALFYGEIPESAESKIFSKVKELKATFISWKEVVRGEFEKADFESLGFPKDPLLGGELSFKQFNKNNLSFSFGEDKTEVIEFR